MIFETKYRKQALQIWENEAQQQKKPQLFRSKQSKQKVADILSNVTGSIASWLSKRVKGV